MPDRLFEELLNETKRLFVEKYGEEPQVLVTAPGRVNLIGEHTDYNGGFVFPMAIERYTIIAAGPSSGETATIFSNNMNSTAEFILSSDVAPAEKVEWTSYVQGVISASIGKGAKVSPFNAIINSNVPIGGGLSSSASLEVAVATLMEELSGVTFDKVEKALMCQHVEHVYAKMTCGIMDQFISVFGQKEHAMLLDCRNQKPEMIPITDPSVTVLITNSNVMHELTGSEYPERRASCEEAARRLGVKLLRDVTLDELLKSKDKLVDETNGDRLFKRAFHVVGEDVRTLKMAEAFKTSDWETVGAQMYGSHDSLRDDYETSCPEIDVLVDIARKIGLEGGMIGSRITGGGFGGCTVSLVKTDKADEIAQILQEEYKKQIGKEAAIFSSRPAQGARVLR
ncbi:MAG: galactokinase [Thermoguttaceae bacterium]